MTILHIDSSARSEGSVTRRLSAQITEQLGGDVIRRDLADPLPLLTETWIGANFTPADTRDDMQRDTLALSDALVNEIKQANTLVIGAPIYNFGIPAVLKAWVDLVARAGLTFKYTENGPVGLLDGKKAIIVMASGGTKIGSDIDFASGYLRHVLGFIGIHDVQFVTADQVMVAGDAAVAAAQDQIAELAA